ncbi:MAG: methyltransferase domain-containing protein [Bacteroidetes bacterium]|nr:methyltransferase domain-containing protein [Bacteroidota bacterium]
MKNKQSDFWSGEFGKEYNIRNSFNEKEWDDFYLQNWGVTKIEMNTRFIGHLPKDIKILEVGANIGMQLRGLQKMGFTNLYGIELQQDAVEKSKQQTKGINIIQGSGYDIPFKDGYFDLVFTAGVLIHIAPENHGKIMSEMVRCSKKYIWGFEYFAEEITDIIYRDNKGFLWKADFSKIFSAGNPELKEVKREYFKYINNDNVDYMYLLEKLS